MSIFSFPEGENVDVNDIDHSNDIQSFVELEHGDGSIPMVNDPQEVVLNLYIAQLKTGFDDPELQPMPPNVFNIENGSVLEAEEQIDEIHMNQGTFTAAFFIGRAVKLGGIDGEDLLPLETLLGLVRDKKLRVDDNIKHL